MHYYQFNIGDYQSHTGHLDFFEDLAYRRMLDWSYLHEKPLPLDPDEIAKIIRMRPHSESIASVLKEFFKKTRQGWVSDRVLKEIESVNEKSEKARRSAMKRWDTNALRTECESNATHNPIPKTHNTRPKTQNIKAPEGVSPEVWDAFVAQRKLSRAAITETVIKSIQRESDKAGWTLEQALSECAARGWRGFKAEWVADKSLGQPVKESAWARKQREDQLRMDEFRGKRSNIIDIPSQEIIFSEFKELSK